MLREKSFLKEKSFKFAVRIVTLYKHLCEKKKAFVLSGQSLRSGMSALLIAAAINGFTAAAQTLVTLDLMRPSLPASFEMASNRIWRYTYSNDYPQIRFNDGVFSFTHLIDGGGFGSENEWGYWDGFTYSMDGDNTDYGSGSSGSWVAHQFGNMAAGGIRTDATGNVMHDAGGRVMTDRDIPYLVGYWGYYKLMWGTSDKQPLQVSLDRVYRAVGVYVNNHPWPYYGNLNGDSFAKPFEREGDHFKLTVHGLDSSLHDSGRSVTHYFAHFRDGALRQNPDWEWVDLSALGDIGGIYFSMESSDTDPQVGINTAAYFCMDRLTVATPEPGTVAVTGVSLDRTSATLKPGDMLQLVATVSPSDADNRAVTWTSGNEAAAIVTVNGRVIANAEGETDIVVRTVDGGFTASCRVTVAGSTANAAPPAARTVYPNPATAFVVVETPVDSPAAIFDIYGRAVLNTALRAGANRLDISRLPAGVYFLKYGRRTVKLIKNQVSF
jgi:uncharacterized protein YjdB